MPGAIFLEEKKDRGLLVSQSFIIQHGQKAPWDSKKQESKQQERYENQVEIRPQLFSFSFVP